MCIRKESVYNKACSYRQDHTLVYIFLKEYCLDLVLKDTDEFVYKQLEYQKQSNLNISKFQIIVLFTR